MKFFIKILILIVAVVIINQSNAQEVRAWSSIDTNAITIGDQIKYELGITVPVSTEVAWPTFVDTLSTNIEILNRSSIDTAISGKEISLRQQLLITSFDSGYFEIPPVDFAFKVGNDTATLYTSTNLLFLQVYVPEVDTSQAFKSIVGPIEEPYTLRELLPWIFGGGAFLIIVGFLIFYFVRRSKRQPVFKRKSKPIIPAHILAISKLEELRLNKVWQSGQLKKYYSELSDIIREYMVNRYSFDAMEMTSYEIINELQEHGINQDAMGKLESVMNLSDMVKFAKAIPTALENDLALTHCVDFVNETKKVPETVNDGNTDKNNNNIAGK